MESFARRIWADIAARRYIDAYVVSGLTLIFAILTIVSDAVSVNLRWAAALAGIGLLVYRLTLPVPASSTDELLRDRTAFEANPITVRLRAAREVWVFAPSGVNILSEENLGALRSGALGRVDGNLRVVVLDPANEPAVELAVRQLDNSLEYQLRDFRACLSEVVGQLRKVEREWKPAGGFGYRFLDHNPGFSLVALDPSTTDGVVIVEFHAFHNEATMSRMHLELRASDSESWYRYWVGQFEHIWEAAHEPTPSTEISAG